MSFLWCVCRSEIPLCNKSYFYISCLKAKVVLYLPDRQPFIQSQLDLFTKSGGKLIKSYQDLPSQPVDMVIDATIGLENGDKYPDWLPYAVSWANQKKAPVLSVDPCILNNPSGIHVFSRLWHQYDYFLLTPSSNSRESKNFGHF